jgi:hypothetical protein
MQVLDSQHRDLHLGEQLQQRREEPVPRGRGVLRGLRCGRQVRRPFREQRPQRAGQRAQFEAVHARAGLAQRVHDRAEGVRLPERGAARDEAALSGGGDELPQQPALADARLALDQDNGWRPRQRVSQRSQLRLPADEVRRADERKPACVASLESHDRRPSPEPGESVPPDGYGERPLSSYLARSRATVPPFLDWYAQSAVLRQRLRSDRTSTGVGSPDGLDAL